MITPRRTRLIRVPNLRVYRRAIQHLALEGEPAATAIVVPTSAAGALLTSTLIPDAGGRTPAVATRAQLYDRLHRELASPRPWLSVIERQALAQAAASEAAAAIDALPFQVRPGLVSELLRFYDHVRRQGQTVERFHDLMIEALGGPDAHDAGGDRMLRQTDFLTRTFHAYERRVRESARWDEHVLRAHLLVEDRSFPTRAVVVTTTDWIAEPDGLTTADFDLLSRLPGLERLDLVATTRTLESGFHARMHEWWPGLEEVDGSAWASPTDVRLPHLAVPATGATTGATATSWFMYRDRQEELVAVAARVANDALDPSACAVVFKHPLPYLYLAHEAFDDFGVGYCEYHGRPLAAEPAVAVVDLVFEAAMSRCGRAPLLEVLRSPYFRRNDAASDPVPSSELLWAFNRALSDARYLGGVDRLRELASVPRLAAFADLFREALRVAEMVATLQTEAPASQLLERLATVLAECLGGPAADTWGADERESRQRLDEVLDGLRRAHAAFHDPLWTLDDLVVAVRRAIADELRQPPPRVAGVHLLDDSAARYADLADVTVVGLLEHEWPERPRRNVFYPPSLLRALGWPSEHERYAADTARFLDLLTSARARVALSTVTLDDESPVSRSLLLDDLSSAALTMLPAEHTAAIPASPPTPRRPRSAESPWRLEGSSRPDADPVFHGSTGARPDRPWSVSALETYLGCPFKFFAQHVLRLEEDPDDEEVMDPRRQGLFVHQVFEAFFRAWQAAGHGAMTPGFLDTARRLFEDVVEQHVAALPEGEGDLERARLLGTPAVSGLGDAVFRMEAERSEAVVERLLEFSVDGECRVQGEAGERVLAIRGKVDRVDLLSDGSFRVIDYKLGWPPDRSRALQLPIYSLCLEQRLAGRHGQQWRTGEALYLAFKGPKRVVPLFNDAEAMREVMARAQQRLIGAVDDIARGHFPPSPDDVYRCDTCSYAAVCRKDYVGPV